METSEKIRKLQKIRVKVQALNRHALTFGEEVTLNNIVYAIDEAVKAYGTGG